MTFIMTADAESGPILANQAHIPTVVQILSTLLFGGFSIVAVIFAFNAFWPAGFVLAAILAWRGGFAPITTATPSFDIDEIVDRLRAVSPEAARRSSGNASFDAYRGDVLKRLEEEQDSFESFLTRLRAAKDQSEFDRFMEDRARAARPISNSFDNA